jgi:FlaA1/EpsC-like NDP-sugar epimerase
VYLFLGLAASRSTFRVLDVFVTQHGREDEQRVLIYGTGDAAEMALRWILMNPELGFRPVGLLDDDPLMNGRQIHGVEVVGEGSGLESILEQRHIDGLILAGLDSNFSREDEIMALCNRHHCWLRKLHLEFELLDKD